MKRLARCLILLVVAGLPIPLFSGGQSQDEAEIRNFSPMSEIKGIQGRPGTMLATETDNRLISS